MSTIALISEHASPLAPAGTVDSGGQNIYVAHVARQLAAAGHHVDVFTRRDAPHLGEVVHWHPRLRVIHVPAGPPCHVPKEEMLPSMTTFSLWMDSFMRAQRRRYYIVHANFFMSGQAGLHVSRSLGIPLVVTFHALGKVRRLYQGLADRFPEARLQIEDTLVRCADRIIAECPEDRHDLERHYHADPAKIAVVPCGYDASEFYPVERARARRVLGWHPRRFTLLQLGRMVPRKGVDNAIEGLARLRADHGIDACLYVVGGDTDDPARAPSPEIDRLKTLAAEHEVDAHVSFVGRRGRDALPLYYGAADVFVTTPWYEPFGITPVEAMACARPVLGSAVGGIRATVQDGQTGFLVPPRDPAALARQAAVLADNPTLGWRMGLAGLRRARELYTWRRVATELERVYRDCTGPVLPAANPGAPAAKVIPLRRGSHAPTPLVARPREAP